MDAYQNGEGAKEAEFQRIAQNISTNIQKISQNGETPRRMVRQLGTPQDSAELRSQLHQIQHYTKQLANDTNRSLKDLDMLPAPLSPSTQRQWKLQRDRLTNDFTTALTSFQKVQRTAAEQEREEVKRARAESGSGFFVESEGRQDPLLQLGPGQSQTQAVFEEEERLSELRERETAVRQLESDIMDVNQIFKDLATMVHEQGEVIDSIEANVESSHANVGQGVQQLAKASEYQNKARRKKLCLFVFLVIVLIIIICVVAYESS
ncbi:LOW QUALITY PROTEIN: syntaxin-7-like [Pollicipes pollicipes]|uniref:LOW QUALITY PROTEIN: syntaxin-7-like n=1 Tax=Pollicipes pollicipes TaxID=41117 RepID=UPI001884CC76|nr:LOW QUALITY PROTEIN: syntaxin-7-like [Pollicipes pollicipes]